MVVSFLDRHAGQRFMFCVDCSDWSQPDSLYQVGESWIGAKIVQKRINLYVHNFIRAVSVASFQPLESLILFAKPSVRNRESKR
jgi:hypothetical protein